LKTNLGDQIENIKDNMKGNVLFVVTFLLLYAVLNDINF